MQRFVDDDAGYLAWVNYPAHREGFVVNSHRTPDRSYLVLHRATCHTITGAPAKGRTWMGGYSKTCSQDRSELERWAAGLGGVLSPCGTCLRKAAKPVQAAEPSSPPVSQPDAAAPPVSEPEPVVADVAAGARDVRLLGNTAYWPLVCACCAQALTGPTALTVSRGSEKCIVLSMPEPDVPLCGRCSEHIRIAAQADALTAGKQNTGVASAQSQRQADALHTQATQLLTEGCCSVRRPVEFIECPSGAYTLCFRSPAYAGRFVRANPPDTVR